MDEKPRLKMYIVLKDGVPPGFAALAAAHASLATYLEYSDHPDVQAWISGRFYKTIVVAPDAEFEKVKEIDGAVTMTESTLGGAEVAIGLRPRVEWPKMLRFLRLYK